MLSTLDVPFVDTNAAELVWTLGHPPASALSTTVVPLDHDDGSVELRVLGASHQVALCWSGGEIVETVACLSEERPHLPAAVDRDVGGRRYRFQAHVETVSTDALRARVAVLRRMAEQDGSLGRMVLAAFPSHPDAVTALRLVHTSPTVSWSTWHIYPNSRQLVTTSTEVRS